MINWKSRYAELLDQREKQQERYRRKQALLISALASSGRLARGVDEKADEKLRAIQGLLRREKLKNVDLEPAVKALDKQMQTSLNARQKNLKRIMSGFKKLSVQTRSLSNAKETVQALKQFEKDLSLKSQMINEIPDSLDRLLKLHKTAVRQGKHSVWRQWLSSSDIKDGTDLIESSEPSMLFEDDEGQIDDEELSAEDEKPISTAKPINIRKVMSNAFTSLLQQLGYPENVAATEQILASRFPLDQIPEIVSSVCELTTDALDRDRREFKSSLDQFNMRLKESNLSVNTCLTLSQGGSDSDIALHNTMQVGFEEIEACVSNASDIEQLKIAVRDNVKNMAKAMAVHQENGQQQNMSAALNSLAQHVRHMEDMTEAAGIRLDTQCKNALIDSVTGLPNRSAYQEYAVEILKTWQRDQSHLCIAVCKIDYFKAILGRFDNNLVEGVLKAIASVFNQQLRDNDKVFRLGGEEFVIFLPETERDQAFGIMEPIRLSFASEEFQLDEEFQPGKESQPETKALSVSIGVANFKGNDSVESAFARADRACGGITNNSKNKTILSPDY